MNTVLHKAETRGHANHGWLNSYHTFSFANYHNPERMNFGVLRVLNDDTVAPNMGFGTHPHKNMEIISIPLEGDLEHKDSMNNVSIINKGEIQILSAGKGLTHSEKNKNNNKEVKFLQIWIIPRENDVEPRYDQISIEENSKINDFQQIVSPNQDDDGIWIHQDAWFHLADFEKENSKEYKIKKEGNGVYIFVIEGKAKIGDQILGKRDGLGITNTNSFILESLENCKILLMDIPL